MKELKVGAQTDVVRLFNLLLMPEVIDATDRHLGFRPRGFFELFHKITGQAWTGKTNKLSRSAAILL